MYAISMENITFLGTSYSTNQCLAIYHLAVAYPLISPPYLHLLSFLTLTQPYPFKHHLFLPHIHPLPRYTTLPSQTLSVIVMLLYMHAINTLLKRTLTPFPNPKPKCHYNAIHTMTPFISINATLPLLTLTAPHSVCKSSPVSVFSL